MRVVIVAESFLPQVNGVTGSVLRLVEHLRHRGHSVLIVAPGPGPTTWGDADVVRVPSIPVPGYASHRVGFPGPWVSSILRDASADLVHLASPTVLGAQGVAAAAKLDLPCIAVYQTDLAAYARRYRVGATSRTVWQWLRWIHNQADLTLAPSRAAADELVTNGISRVHLWPRGVDTALFRPERRDHGLREALSPDGRLLVGYVGRLAAEKQVDLLAALQHLAGVQLVLVGDGPRRAALEQRLPHARFLGLRHGEELATIFASLDLFVHTGVHETFCQAAQEALASGVPVVAPAAGGLLDLVEHGVNGLLYRPGSASDLRAAVTSLLPGDVRRAMAGAAPGTVGARTWTVVGDRYLSLASSLLHGTSEPLAA